MNYSREKLYNLSIYEVRKIGQIEGVKSPTSMKKDELIDEIMAITSGTKERYIPTNKKGRPSKAFKELDFLRDFDLKKEEPKKSFFDTTLDVCAPNMEEVSLYKMGAEDDGEVEGFIDIINGEFGIIRSSFSEQYDFVFVLGSMIKENQLKKGEYVKVSVLKLGNGKKIANNLISRSNSNSEIDFMALEPIYPTKTINFEKNQILNQLSPIGNGQRALISLADENFLEDALFNLFNQVDLKKMFIIFGAQPEEKEKFKNSKNIICIENEKGFSLVKLAVNILHREAEKGEDCILFVFGFEKMKLYVEQNDILKEIYSAFKNTKEAGSVTLIAGSFDEVPNNLKNVFNLIIQLDEKLAIYGIDFPIDVEKLSLSRKDGLLNETNIENIKRCKIALLESREKLINEFKKFK